MKALTLLPALWCLLYCFVEGASDSFLISSYRDRGDARSIDALSKIRKRQSGNLTSSLGKSLYWFGNFSVGDSGSLKLLIDTGSSDLIVNPGLYKPSSDKKSYGSGKFSITYEGVNRAGFGFETINGTTQRDKVTAAGLTVTDQPLGVTKSFKYFAVPQLPYPNQGQGIIGFLGPGSSSFHPPAPSWFYSLCGQNLLSEKRFGLAFGTSGTGLTVVGKLASSLIDGGLVALPRIPGFEAYTVIGDVTIDNKIVVENQTIIMDVGTDNIQGPIAPTKLILKKLGYPTTLLTSKDNKFDPGAVSKTLLGFFPCNKPPTLGFSFPAKSQLKSNQTAKVFNVSPAVWDVYNHGGNNCTSILGGTNALTDPKTGEAEWLLGQSFFAGHYVDFDLSADTVSFGDLVDPTGEFLGHTEVVVGTLTKHLAGHIAGGHTLKWLATCNIEHNSSCSNHPISTLEDSFFIDVEDGKIVSGKVRESESYFALSYVRGGHRGVELTTENQDELSRANGLLNYNLLQTYKDAMRLTRLCNERYLWIDFLCIMHDDKGSSQRQVDAMDKIYGEAALVLIAALGSSPTFGSYPKSVLPRKVQGVWLHLSRGDLASDNFAHLEDVMTATYWTRSWCFQEQFVSFRRLYFGAHWLRFHCRGMETIGHIDARGRFKIEDVSEVENFSPYDHSWAMRTISQASQYSSNVRFPDLFRGYGTTVQGFTERELTYAQDIERAFAGIASVLKRIPDNHVHAGVPTALLPHALLWYPWTKTTPAKLSSTAHFPSWSWMSAAAAVTYSPLHNGADEESEALYTLKSLVAFESQRCETVLDRSVFQFQAFVILASHFKLRPRQVDVMQDLGLEVGNYDFSEADNAEFEPRGIYFPGERYNVGQVKGLASEHECCFESDRIGGDMYHNVALTALGLTYYGLLVHQSADISVRVGLIGMEAKAFGACDPDFESIRLH